MFELDCGNNFIRWRVARTSFQDLLAGADATLVSASMPDARWVPYLVFFGLAIACPLS
ncbi:hypothetical protein [Pseudomonas asplenii]|uniref:hypothetical protein n=1 Tax=Pseudomonas asplenii TaxID=53407 RepID=UPI000ADAB4BA